LTCEEEDGEEDGDGEEKRVDNIESESESGEMKRKGLNERGLGE